MDSGKAACCCVPYYVLVHFEYLSYYNYNDHTLFYFYYVLLGEHLALTLSWNVYHILAWSTHIRTSSDELSYGIQADF